jgi:hypothetical protein
MRTPERAVVTTMGTAKVRGLLLHIKNNKISPSCQHLAFLCATYDQKGGEGQQRSTCFVFKFTKRIHLFLVQIYKEDTFAERCSEQVKTRGRGFI